MNYHSVTMVYSASRTNVLDTERSFSVYSLFNASNKCFPSRITIQCLLFVEGCKQMLHYKKYYSMLMVCSVPQTNASSKEISHSVNGLFGDLKQMFHPKNYHSVLMVYSGSQTHASCFI